MMFISGLFLRIVKAVSDLYLVFHHLSVLIGFLTTLTIHAIITSFLEPVKNVSYSFLLTFPLTTGLIVIFLILFNLDWKKITPGHLFYGPLMFALFFIFLNGISHKFHFYEKGQFYIARQDSLQHIEDSTKNPAAYQEKINEEKLDESLKLIGKYHKPILNGISDTFYSADKGQAYITRQGRLQPIIDSMKNPGANQENTGKISQEELNQYTRLYSKDQKPIRLDSVTQDLTKAEGKRIHDNSVISYFKASMTVLISQIHDFYLVYGRARFWSGVLVAIFFAHFVLKYARKKENSHENAAQP